MHENKSIWINTRRFRLSWFVLLTDLLILAIAIVMVHSFYWRHAAWWKAMGTFDNHAYFGPLYAYIDYWLHRGIVPLWNPLVLCGTPLSGGPQSSLFYPPNLLRGLLNVHATPAGAQISMLGYCAFHLLVAGLGTLRLARSHGFSRSAQFLAAFAFMFASIMTRRVVDQFNVLALVSYAPWVLLCLKKSLDASQARPRYAWALGAGLVFGLSTLAGQPDHTLYLATMVALYGLIYGLLASPEASRAVGFRERCAKSLIVPGIAMAVAVAIALPMLLPAAELAQHSDRMASSGLQVHQLAGLSQAHDGVPAYRDPWHIFQCMAIFPGGPYGLPTFGRGSGIITLLAGLAALSRLRRRDILVFFILYLVLFDLSIEARFSIGRLLRAVSPYQIGIPFRANLLLQLPFAMLAGAGLDVLMDAARERTAWAVTRRIATLVAGLLLIGVLFAWLLGSNPLHPTPLRATASVAGVAVLVLGAWLGPRFGLRMLVPVLFLCDAALWTPVFVQHFFDSEPLTPCTLPYAALAQPRSYLPTNSRGVDFENNHALYELRAVMNGYEPVHAAEVFGLLQAPGDEGAFSRWIAYQDPTAKQTIGDLYLKRRFWLAKTAAKRGTLDKHRLFPAADVVFLENEQTPPIPAADALPDQAVRAEAQTIAVDLPPSVTHPFPLTSGGKSPAISLPVVDASRAQSALDVHFRSTVQGKVNVLFQDRATGATIPGTTFAIQPNPEEQTIELAAPDYAQLVCTLRPELESSSGGGTFQVVAAALRCDTADENALIHLREDTPNRIVLDVGPLPGPRILAYLDAAYPGWKAYVDQRLTPLLRAHGVFKAVSVPEGRHEICFVFRPWRVYAGLTLSLVVLALAGAYIVRVRLGRSSRTMGDPC